ncbi:hypothetical protein Btru_059251 [Bulinus truncatus]|nr:hypothetical protein Btru_059251 [Bulinus truncatus]
MSTSNVYPTNSTQNTQPDDVTGLFLKVLPVVCNSVVCSLIGAFGLGANVTNILVFYRNGLSNSVNMSFFFRSASDVMRILSILWSGVSLNPYVDSLQAPVRFGDVFYATGGMVSSCTTRVTVCITVYVTLERCLCVLLPLKVKTIFTPGRTLLVMVLVYVINIASFIPVYSSMQLVWAYSGVQNRSILSLVFKDKRTVVEGLSYVINNAILTAGVILLFIFTFLLMVLVKVKARWRKENAADKDQVKMTTARDTKLMVMVLAVALVVVGCVTPRLLLTAVSAAVPDFNFGGRYETVFRTAHYVLYIFAAVDSTVNILIYYTISANYRQAFYTLVLEKMASEQNLLSEILVFTDRPDGEPVTMDQAGAIDLTNSDVFNLLVVTLPFTLIEIFDFFANILNVWVFAVQGFSNPVGISFFTIALSDIVRVVFILYENFCVSPYADLIDSPVRLDELFFVTGAFPLGCVIRITLYVTIYVTAERFLCIMFPPPLSVKTMITRTTTLWMVVSIAVLNFLTLYPVYLTYFLAWNFYPDRNKTLLGLGVVYTDPVNYGVNYFLHSVLVVLGLGVLLVFTFALVIQLSRKSSWRARNTASVASQKVSLATRNRKSMRLVVVVAFSFAVSFTPLAVICLLAFYVPEFSFGGPLDALYHYLYIISLVFLSVNSSTNIFIYFKMSRNYRETLQNIFARYFYKKFK